jgi:riboflavin biosynthesis pyrimidine reductase
MTCVLVEGGNRVMTSFFEENLVNEVAFFVAPFVQGTHLNALGSNNLNPMFNSHLHKSSAFSTFGEDLCFQGSLKW